MRGASRVVVVAVLAGCGHRTVESATPLASDFETASRLLPGGDFGQVDTTETKSSGLVVLIGENHAHVKTQQQVARMLSALVEHRAIDALLVEGFEGPFETRKLASTYEGL